MKPIPFEQQTDVIGESQDEYQDLPAHVDRITDEREFISCWHLSFSERVKVLFTGKIWNRQYTFGHSYAPTLLQSHSPWD